MLFQLDDLKISDHTFRLLFSIIRRAYYDKVIECTISSLQEWTGLTRYRIKQGLEELKSEKLLQVVADGYKLEVTLLPKIIKMITLDYKRRGGSKSKGGEIKKSGAASKSPQRKNTPTPQKKTSCKPLSPTSHQTGFESSGKSTLPKVKQKPSEQPVGTDREQTLATKPKPKPVIPVKGKENLKALLKGRGLEYTNARGELYKYFETWLRSNEAISDPYQLSVEDLSKKWKEFKGYTVTWLRLQNSLGSTKCADLNRIKFYKKIAAEYKAQSA